MSRRALATAVVAAGVSVVLYALISGFVVAVSTATSVTMWWLYGGLGAGIALAAVGLTCINVSDQSVQG